MPAHWDNLQGMDSKHPTQSKLLLDLTDEQRQELERLKAELSQHWTQLKQGLTADSVADGISFALTLPARLACLAVLLGLALPLAIGTTWGLFKALAYLEPISVGTYLIEIERPWRPTEIGS